MATRAQQTFEFPADYAATFDATHLALGQLGFRVDGADARTGDLRARSSISAFSWGENLSIQVRLAGERRTAVTVSSSLKFGLVDWGRNKKNLEKLHSAIIAALNEVSRWRQFRDDRSPPGSGAPTSG